MENENSDLQIKRHSLSHVLAKAIKKLYPNAKLTIGPAISDGFYYDFDMNPIDDSAFENIEQEIRNILNKNEAFKKIEVSKEDALKLFADNIYKTEIINELNDNEKISIYKTGDDFIDLCRGPHVENTSQLQNMGFKVAKTAGAYWRGNSNNKMLQRIYVYAFANQKELSDHLNFLEDAKKRDHRLLAKDLDLFFFSDYAPGLPFYKPNGVILRNELIKFWRELHHKNNYIEIETPIMLNRKLWDISGHWDHYKDGMYTLKVDTEDYAIKPMSCPGGILYYKQSTHSYKELPLRIAELGHVHRSEDSGALHGMFRTRSFVQDDAHIYMTPSQIESEVINILNIIDEIYKTFGLTAFVELSTMPESHIGDEKDWKFTEEALKKAIIKKNLKYKLNPGDGAFYGPKIDIHITDAIKRTWQCGTIQLDMQLPKRFNMEYVDADGSKKQPVMIHRTLYGSLERITGVLLEHFAGKLPVWLSPVQVIVANVSENSEKYAKFVANQLDKHGIRAMLDNRNEKISFKIRESQIKKAPYTIIVGEKENNNKTISYRGRNNEQVSDISLHEFICNIQKQINNRLLDNQTIDSKKLNKKSSAFEKKNF